MKLIKAVQLLLISVLPLLAAYAQFYPIEIFVNPIGVQNLTPGADKSDYTTFTGLRVVLNKDLPSNKKISNKFVFNGSAEWFHQSGYERDYFPFYINPIIKSHLFLSDIITAGVEANGNLESLYGIDTPSESALQSDSTVILDSMSGSTAGTFLPPYKMLYNVRGRLIPFFYIALTPDLLLYNAYTFGRSYNTEETFSKLGMVKNDYNILKAETKFIYFSNFHVRFFIAPYVYKNNYLYRTARSSDGTENALNPLLREDGYGTSLGARYSTFKWGYIEFQTELEKNIDKIYGSNDYKKLYLNLKMENQYFTERFGYLFSVGFTRYYFSNYVTSTDPADSETGKLADKQFTLDVMPIINFSKNISLRPQYDLYYKEDENGSRTKNRFWLNLHFLW